MPDTSTAQSARRVTAEAVRRRRIRRRIEEGRRRGKHDDQAPLKARAKPSLVREGREGEEKLRANQGAAHPLPRGAKAPGFRAPRAGEAPAKPIDFEKVSFVTHGLPPRYLAAALGQGQLSSAYSRLGPEPAPPARYSRPTDARYGGGTGVYTRAYGTDQLVPATGYGVGSGKGKVQLLMSPAILEDSVWRASTYDGGGKLPGVTKPVNLKDANDIVDAWQQQTEAERNDAFMKTIGPKAVMQNAEQIHYERIPLTGVAKVVVCTHPDDFEGVFKEMGGDAKDGFVTVDGEQIRVLLVDPKADLRKVLFDEGLADADGRLR